MEESDTLEAFRRWDVRWADQLESWVSQLENLDVAHDISHIRRVVLNAGLIGSQERANPEVVMPAAWLHDCISVRKDSPDRSRASRMAADQAVLLLGKLNYPTAHLEPIHHAILAHSFSAGVSPVSLEAKVVQDADRLDALGAIGIARCFGTAGAMHSTFYNHDEILPQSRSLDDRRFALDHFFAKLLKLPTALLTESGRSLATSRVQFMADYLRQFVLETEPRLMGELEALLTSFQLGESKTT